MAKRGRPRYPDILTPREWEVLALLRERLSNDGIAGRLDITERTAKYHVSEILGKLGLTSRDEAAAWQPEERPWWLAAGVPFAFVWRKLSLSWLSPATAAVLGVLVATGAGLLVWGLVRTGGDGGAEARPRSAIVAPTDTPEPDGELEVIDAGETIIIDVQTGVTQRLATDERWQYVKWLGPDRLVTLDPDAGRYVILEKDGAVLRNDGPLNDGFHLQPAPDGSGLLVYNDESGTLSTFDVATGAMTTLPTEGSRVQVQSAAWSPDGTRLAYIALDEGGARIVVADADAANPRTLYQVSDPDRLGASVAGFRMWSPDGAILAFSLGTPAPECGEASTTCEQIDWEHYAISVDGGKLVERPRGAWLGTTKVIREEHRLLPDGSGEFPYFIIDIATGIRQEIGTPRDVFPSPDGTWVAMIGGSQASVKVVNLETGVVHLLDAHSRCAGLNAGWSANSRRVIISPLGGLYADWSADSRQVIISPTGPCWGDEGTS